MPTRDRAIDLIAVAKRQRELMWLIVFGAGVYLAMIVSAVAVPMVAFGAALVQLLFQLAGLVQVIRLSAAMGAPVALRVVYIVLMFLPLIGLITLLVINGQATGLLKAAGARVGLMGVPRSEYPKFMTGHCRGCGYDRAGLEMLQACPECGRVPQVV
jgi:hypothetical protein